MGRSLTGDLVLNRAIKFNEGVQSSTRFELVDFLPMFRHNIAEVLIEEVAGEIDPPSAASISFVGNVFEKLERLLGIR